ncbi:hypothetical protein D9758_008329 [Tetrapyrgos nigripes]|uniref:Uncharacterized protein n=1 Tax=Tetrapyrgos nigripes TaxID=182062 RepID=A0A8H5LMK7_9AGAR|nr:hypothetical protein D9758_008329 [Tetrapyrgos nigripes]
MSPHASSSPIQDDQDDIHDILYSFYLSDNNSESEEDPEEPLTPYAEYMKDPFNKGDLDCEEEDGELYDLYGRDYCDRSSINSSPDLYNSDSESTSPSPIRHRNHPSSARGRPFVLVHTCKTQDEAAAVMGLPGLSIPKTRDTMAFSSIIIESEDDSPRVIAKPHIEGQDQGRRTSDNKPDVSRGRSRSVRFKDEVTRIR